MRSSWSSAITRSRRAHDGHVAAIDAFLRSAPVRGRPGSPAARSRETLPGAPGAALTAREREVLRHVAAGLTNKEIAVALRVAVPAVERHLANISTKIDARGRVAAAACAFRHGLVKPRS